MLAVILSVSPRKAMAGEEAREAVSHLQTLVVVSENGLFGLESAAGEEILPCKFSNIWKETDQGPIVAEEERKLSDGKIEKNLLLFNRAGEPLTSDTYQYVRASGAGDTLVIGKLMKGADEEYFAYGLMDKDGNIIVTCSYRQMSGFDESGLSLVKKQDFYGFIDQRGVEVIPCTYSFAMPFGKENVTMVKNVAGQTGYIDTANQIVVDFSSDISFPPHNGIIPVLQDAIVCFMGLDHQINVVSNRVMDVDRGYLWENGYFVFVDNQGKMGCIYSDGSEVLPFEYDYIVLSDDADADLLRTPENVSATVFQAWKGEISGDPMASGVLYNGRPYFAPDGYVTELRCGDGKALLRTGNLYGYLNASGAVLVEPVYEEAEPFSKQGLALVKREGRYQFIDETGNTVLLLDCEEASSFSDAGFAILKRGSIATYIDENGEMLKEEQLSEADGMPIYLYEEGYTPPVVTAPADTPAPAEAPAAETPTAAPTEAPAPTATPAPEVPHRYEVVVANVTWTEAYQACRARGGRLAVIETEQEWQQLMAMLDGNPAWSGKVFFVGGRRELSGDDTTSYCWVDENNQMYGSPLNAPGTWTYNYWLTGQPSYRDEMVGTTEHVLSVFKYQGRWGLNDDAENVLAVTNDYYGIIGYICEYGY